MATRGANLYRLQCLDSEGDAKQHRMDEIEAALGESEAMQQARQAVKKAETLIKKWTLRQRDLELKVEGLSDKITRSEQRLYSGTVKNPKELEDLQAEAAAVRRQRRKLEDDLLEAMIEREEAETTHAQAQDRLSEIRADWSAQQADLMAERETLQTKLAEIEQARAGLLPGIEASDLAAYCALRRRKGGLAVVRMQDDACGACGVGVSPSLKWQLREEGITYCGNCERIIVRE